MKKKLFIAILTIALLSAGGVYASTDSVNSSPDTGTNVSSDSNHTSTDVGGTSSHASTDVGSGTSSGGVDPRSTDHSLASSTDNSSSHDATSTSSSDKSHDASSTDVISNEVRDHIATSSGMEVNVEHGVVVLKPHDTPEPKDKTLASTTSGRILLQVEQNGEAWYNDPVSNHVAYLGTPANAFQVMRQYGLGITDANLNKIGISGSSVSGGVLAKRLAGRILIQVQGNGEAWYIDPATLQRVFLGTPADAFKAMRGLGLGITNNNLAKLAEIK